MIYLPIYTPVALIEYKDAVNWYYIHSKKAAKNFVMAIREKLKSICENPTRYRKGYKHF